MARELVSVVIPAYNQGQFIRDAVLSALEQTYQPLEVIVIDDGSADDTREQLRPLVDRITYVCQKNAGPSAARNAGILRARGEWIALLDADDLWHPQKLEIQLGAVRGREDVALVGSSSASSLTSFPLPCPKVYELSVRDFVLSARVGPSGVLIRRRCLAIVGLFDESLRLVEDRDMWLRLAARFSCLLVDSPCWWYRLHPTQINRNGHGMFVSYTRVLSKFFAMHPQHQNLYRQAMAYLYFDAVWPHFEEGRRFAALYFLARSVCYRPQGLGDQRKTRLIRSKMALRVMLGARPSGPDPT